MNTHALAPEDRAPLAKLLEMVMPHKGEGEIGPAGRAEFDAMMERTPAAKDIKFEAATVGGVPGWWCRPKAPRATMLYLHGGAYVQGSAKAYRNFASQIAARAQAALFVADYRLAPEHPFPAAFDDALAAFKAISASAIIGDSAGGGLALAILPHTHARAVAVMSPWTDLTLTNPSYESREKAEPYLTRDGLAKAAKMYLGDHDPTDARVSPAYGNMKNLPPVLIHVGDAEILLDDSLSYEAATVHVWDGMPHVFPSSIGTFKAAERALDHIGAFLQNH